MNGWHAVAHRGEFSISILTPTRAREKNLTAPAGAALFALLHDGEEPLACVLFASLETLNVFIREMQPRSVEIASARSDDATAVAALREIVGQTAPLTIN